jgi:hypothetical protein
VTIALPKQRKLFAPIMLVFMYTTVLNVFERPEGIKIASWFILAIIGSSLVSRVMRATELRMEGISYDETAAAFIGEAAGRDAIRILAIRPNTGQPSEYARKLAEARRLHHLPAEDTVLFLEVRPADASDFANQLSIMGADVGGHHVLRCSSPAIPNAIAALLLDLRRRTGGIPHAYFGWTEGNPITYLLKYLAFGEGDTAPVCREVLRQAEPDPERRPRIHLG